MDGDRFAPAGCVGGPAPPSVPPPTDRGDEDCSPEVLLRPWTGVLVAVADVTGEESLWGSRNWTDFDGGPAAPPPAPAAAARVDSESLPDGGLPNTSPL